MSVVDDFVQNISDLYFNGTDLAEVDLRAIPEIAASQSLSAEFARKIKEINDPDMKAEVVDALSRYAGQMSDEADVEETLFKFGLPSTTAIGGPLIVGGAVFGAIKATSIAGVLSVGAPLIVGGVAVFAVGGYALIRLSAKKRSKLKSEREIKELIERIR